MALNPNDLRVESFEVDWYPPEPTTNETWPHCMTATGCTCYDWCLSFVSVCDTVDPSK